MEKQPNCCLESLVKEILSYPYIYFVYLTYFINVYCYCLTTNAVMHFVQSTLFSSLLNQISCMYSFCFLQFSCGQREKKNIYIHTHQLFSLFLQTKHTQLPQKNLFQFISKSFHSHFIYDCIYSLGIITKFPFLYGSCMYFILSNHSPMSNWSIFFI